MGALSTRASVARPVLAFVVAAIAATARPDASSAPAASLYASSAVVRLAPGSRTTFEFDGAVHALPHGTTTVNVAEQARKAVEDAARRMFAPSTGEASLVIEVAVAASDVVGNVYSSLAFVEHDVVARTSSGAEIARWRVRGESSIVGLDTDAVVRALDRAADRAARAFEKEFDASPAVQTWLGEQGIARRAPPPAAAAAPRPARAAAVSWIEVGPGIDRDGRTGLGARIGLSGRRLLAAVAVDVGGASFPVNSAFGTRGSEAQLRTTALGIDAALLRRFGGTREAQLGVGARMVRGTAALDYVVSGTNTSRDMTITKWALAGALFAGIHQTSGPWTSLGMRGRVGAEVRMTFGGKLTYDAYQTSFTPPALSASVFVGLELPAGRGSD